jgi:predicted dinucleotide-binding enzyme
MSRTIGIIGAGHMGQALAGTALRAGREVVISTVAARNHWRQ